MEEGSEPIIAPLGERMKAFRESIGLSQVQLAALVGGTKRGIQGNEWGKAAPNSKILFGLVKLGLNANWLLTGEGEMLLNTSNESNPPQMAVDAENLGHALAAVENIATQRGITLSANKRAKLAALVYQYFLLDKAETETAAYLSQLMELVSN